VEKWIGKFEVVPIDPADPELEGISGAFVQVIALSENEDDFLSLARQSLHEEGFNVIAADDIEELEVRLRCGKIDDHLAAAAKELSLSNRVFLGDFHAWGH